MPAWAASVTRGKYPTFVRSSISARRTNSRPQISLLGHRYTGPDCSDRVCVSGIDPLYTDDTTAQVTHTTVRFKSSDASALSGQYSIKFYDITGEDWLTDPISISGTGDINGKTHCESVTEALLMLPNGVVPSIECSQDVLESTKGVEYTLTFTGNPGHLRELELDQYLDGSRPTVQVSSGTLDTGVHTKVAGESKDYFAQRCEGITVKVLADSDNANAWTPDNVRPGSLGYLSGPSGPLTAAEKKLLKKCLGDSDWDVENNVEVANWDTGVLVESDGTNAYNMIGAFPHAIKVVPVESTSGYSIHTPGSYQLVWYDADATNKEFRVANINSAANAVGEADEMYVYTTKGTVQQMGWGTEGQVAENPAPGGTSSTRIVGFFDKESNRIYTNYDTSCTNNPSSPNARNFVCVNKGDKLFVVDSCWGIGDAGAGTINPIFGGTALNECADSGKPNTSSGNIYTVTKVTILEKMSSFSVCLNLTLTNFFPQVYTVPIGSDSTTDPATLLDISTDPKTYVNTNIIEVDASFAWIGLKGDPENSNDATTDRDLTWSDNTGVVVLFHFTPDSVGTFEYVSECSNRGLCSSEGICECFDG